MDSGGPCFMKQNLMEECLPDRHKQRDNKFGVTWCVKCGRLFNKPCGVDLQENDIVLYGRD